MTHTTKYGNTYTNQEWAELQAHYAVENKKQAEFGKKLAGMENFLRRQLTEIGVPANAQNTVVNEFKSFSWTSEGKRFSSEARRRQLDDLYARWEKAFDFSEDGF